MRSVANALLFCSLLSVAFACGRLGFNWSSVGCSESSPCAVGVCVDGLCVPCARNADCDRAKLCRGSTCESRPVCDTSRPCSSGTCVGQLCMDCTISSECGSGSSCEQNVCVPLHEACDGALTCNNHGACDDSTGSVSCDCDAGYAGARCEQCASVYVDDGSGNCVLANACAPSDPCAAVHRTCSTQTGVAVCGACLTGYYEDAGNCLVDACLAGPCVHGSCQRTGNGAFACQCDPGYAGSLCDGCALGYAQWPALSGVCVDNPCDPEPCTGFNVQPGSCVQTDVAAYSCQCVAGTGLIGGECLPPWDIAGVFDQADMPIDANQLQIFGQVVIEGQEVQAPLDGATDNTFGMQTIMCFGNPSDRMSAWDIERTFVDATTYRILVRGVSAADCTWGGQPENRGQITVNPLSPWSITQQIACSASPDLNNNWGSDIPTWCTVDAAAGTVTWQAGSGCIGCCACPDGAGVGIEIVLSR